MASMVNGLAFVLKYANRSSFSVPPAGMQPDRLVLERMRSYEEEK